ncbi:midcut-by-XrtH protein [Mangrovimicrobium sediminis]|uniref:Midcut-by-XrtH protein n=1 Tax=Mangrovimicrobium sediminis TaxID=2562682 RepID=A0A4Z0M6G1_9GAMM|nr:midcut-by-XrtH protein [Haliea sp. SAOS-164]TGD75101.1 midcut-by-XrtH protein [Haliea sp. SAOS-164]
MRKYLAGSFFGLAFAQLCHAQPTSFSTIRINWAAADVEAVPTMSTYAIALLAVLVALVALRMTRHKGAVLRMLAPLLALGVGAVATTASLYPNQSVAGLVMTPPSVETDGNCSGSSTYTAVADSGPPPCFVNTCGQPVEVTYTFIEGADGFGTPLTPGTCTFLYYCGDNGEGGPYALDGSSVPSDGGSYGTAYCEEIFDGGDNPS